ncbi:MAG: hypothetical protein ACK4GT_00070 [Pararhodobacter sp.]
MFLEAAFTRGGVIRAVDSSGAVSFIPDDPANADRQALAAWEAGGGQIAPAASQLELAKSDATAEVMTCTDRYGALFVAGYPDCERQSWPQKLIEARLIAGGEADPEVFPIIAAEAEITGAAPTDIASWILARAAVFEKAVGIVSGFRQMALAGIEAAEDAEGVQAALDAAKALADQKLAALG